MADTPWMLRAAATHHVEHLGVLAGGQHHLGLEARLQEEAVSRHGAASAAERKRSREEPSGPDTGEPQRDGAAQQLSHSSPPTRFLLL